MNLWTSEEITKILIQLDDMQLPFEKYSFVRTGVGLTLLGRGGSAEVYEAKSRASDKAKYAIKVIGFRKQNCDSDFFNESVTAQKDIISDFVVKIYKHTELWVSFDEQDNVIEALKKKPKEISRTTIKLQFIVMEKLDSVIERTKAGNIKMKPEQLADSDEQEVLKLAYDIGYALKEAHKNKILHRDVKLENVFYSEKKKSYKLGDFGIAKKTENGFAGTVAFTKGYAAPEVRASDDRYDYTADIYSFGIMLYVLMNRLKFPDSNTYNVNSSTQYSTGYVVPIPEGNISEEFYSIIAKACMYDADERYQSMDIMLEDIEKLIRGKKFEHSIRHKKEYLIIGIILLELSVIAWKLTFVPEITIDYNIWQYVFLTVCIVKGIQKFFKLNVAYTSILVLGLGIYLLITTGFTWIGLILLVLLTFSSGMLSCCVATGFLIANLTSVVQRVGSAEQIYMGYRWLTVTGISLGFIFLSQYIFFWEQDRRKIKSISNRYFWVIICFIYIGLIVVGQGLNSDNYIYYEFGRKMWGENVVNILYSMELKNIGIAGLGCCILWKIREQLINLKNKRAYRINNTKVENNDTK